MANPQPPPPQRRFKPRAGIQRKTAEERAASIQAEALRQANQAHLQSPQTQSEGERRTGSVQRDARTKNQHTGSVFSSIGGVTNSRAKSTHLVSGTEELVQRAEGDDTVRVEGEASREVKAAVEGDRRSAVTNQKPLGRPPKSTAKKDDIIYVSGDEAEGIEGKAVDIDDIDRISISSDDDKDDGIVFSHRKRVNRTPKPTLGLRPVRATRDFVPRGDGFNEARTEGKNVKGKGANKAGLDHGDMMMDLDDGDGDTAVTAKQTTPTPNDKAVFPSESPTKRRRKSSMKDTRPEFQTVEERAERERYTADLRKLRNELSSRSLDTPQRNAEMSDTPFEASADGRLYLFQFPPLTPMLVDPSHQPEVKAEPIDDSTEPNPAPSAPPAAPPETQIKKEDGGVHIATAPVPDAPKVLNAANSPALPPGLAGKLNVHQSGKVTLEWGGNTSLTNMEVRWGSEVDFLQDLVLTSGAWERKVWALRQVRNKFVVVPDWGKLYE